MSNANLTSCLTCVHDIKWDGLYETYAWYVKKDDKFMVIKDYHILPINFCPNCGKDWRTRE